VAETTRLTVVLAFGSLVGFGLASRWLGRGGQPMAVAALGAMVGGPAFLAVMGSAAVLSVPMLLVATLAAGFGAGLFGHGTLTATMRAAPRDQIGLALGAWGAVQTTAAGIAIAAAGLIRDAMLLVPETKETGAVPYLPVFALEAGLLALALGVAWPLLRRHLDSGVAKTTLKDVSIAGGPVELAAIKT
jgi:BCD family chlorophyll transporter-like MFS transporter